MIQMHESYLNFHLVNKAETWLIDMTTLYRYLVVSSGLYAEVWFTLAAILPDSIRNSCHFLHEIIFNLTQLH